MVSLSNYFKYHPPLTEKRKLAHDAANKLCLTACQDLFEARDLVIVETICDGLSQSLLKLTDDVICQRWIQRSIDLLIPAAIGGDEEAILMYVQQARMFANQGITVDELKLEDVYADKEGEEHY